MHGNTDQTSTPKGRRKGLSPLFLVLWAVLVAAVSIAFHDLWYVALIFSLCLTAAFWLIDAQIRSGRWSRSSRA